MPLSADLALESCSREPIHVPGSIQPHGLLLVLDPASDEVLQAAGHPESLLGYRGSVVGSTMKKVLGKSLSDLLRDANASLMDKPTCLGSLSIGGDGARSAFTVTALQANGVALLELEPSLDPTPAPRVLADIRAMIARIGEAADVLEACGVAAREVRRLTEYDRVMIYRFEPDGSGSVIAEEKDTCLSALLNHRYPASDIPEQARELYRKNPIRVIPDVSYVPAPLIPAMCPRTGMPRDLSYCHLRSVSPVHIQYLKNMGVGASMSLSILRGGELWGLIACHNSIAKAVSWEVREVCQHVAQALSQSIGGREDAANYRTALSLAQAREELLSILREAADFEATLLAQVPGLQAIVPSSGAAVVCGAGSAAAGNAPSLPEVGELATWLEARRSGSAPFVTDCLSEHYAKAMDFASNASGLLSVTLPSEPPTSLMWFRAEQVEEIRWGGNPHEPLEPGALLGTLNPRKSFATWTETVWGRCRPWSSVEVEAARSFGRRITFIMQQHQIRRLNERLSEANEQLARLATTDALTGLANRRGLDEWLLRDSARSKRQQNDLAIIAVDIDGFKQYNDYFGHAAGDECLRRVAEVLTRGRRATDLVARTGGEEFCLILPMTSLEAACAVAESIRAGVEALGLENPRSALGVVTASLGVSTLQLDRDTHVLEGLRAADRALYQAKEAGRNRVVRL